MDKLCLQLKFFTHRPKFTSDQQLVVLCLAKKSWDVVLSSLLKGIHFVLFAGPQSQSAILMHLIISFSQPET